MKQHLTYSSEPHPVTSHPSLSPPVRADPSHCLGTSQDLDVKESILLQYLSNLDTEADYFSANITWDVTNLVVKKCVVEFNMLHLFNWMWNLMRYFDMKYVLKCTQYSSVAVTQG